MLLKAYSCLKLIKYFKKRLKYSKILTQGPFVSITSLRRIVTVILEIIHEEFEFFFLPSLRLLVFPLKFGFIVY